MGMKWAKMKRRQIIPCIQKYVHIISHNEAEIVSPYTLQQQVVSHEQTTGVQEC